MRALSYSTKQKRRASTLLALALSERDAAISLLTAKLFREAVVHMYFTCFYVSQAVLADKLSANPTHKNLESQLHKAFGRHSDFPRRYVELHSFLHELRTQFNYRATHTPSPKLLQRKATVLSAYVQFALRIVPRVEVGDILRGICEDNPGDVVDFSYDIYCPKTYAHHTRLTFWQPPFYLDLYKPADLATNARRLLASLKVNRANDYVVGVNSRLHQYAPVQLIMLDMDTLDAAVESALKPVGGILLRTGRGFHFIGTELIRSQKEWERRMRALARNRDLKPHLDKDHIDISLKRGYSTLRITASAQKPDTPFFFKEL